VKGTANRFLVLVAWCCPLVILYTLYLHVVNVPSSWDEWDAWVPLILAAHAGTLKLSALWAPHNEHRMFVVNVLMLLLAKAGGWNIFRETLTSLGIVVLTQAVLWRLVVESIPARLGGASFFLLSACLYSLGAYENWLTGFQIPWFLVNLAAVLVIALLWLHPRSAKAFVLAAATSFLASFSMSSGLGSWFAGLFVLLIRLPRASRRTIGIWILFAACAFALYFYGYVQPPQTPKLFAELADPLGMIAYVLAYFGGPFGAWVAPSRIPLSVALGALGIAAFLALLLLYRRDRRIDPGSAAIETPWIALAGYSLLVGILTTAGRSGFGAEQALTSRYTTGAMLLWIGLIALVTIRLDGRLRDGRPWPAVEACALCVAFFGFCYVETAFTVQGPMDGMTSKLSTAARALAHLETASNADLEILYPDAARVRRDAIELRRFHDGPYF
jgi:hypothetical protein